MIVTVKTIDGRVVSEAIKPARPTAALAARAGTTHPLFCDGKRLDPARSLASQGVADGALVVESKEVPVPGCKVATTYAGMYALLRRQTIRGSVALATFKAISAEYAERSVAARPVDDLNLRATGTVYEMKACPTALAFFEAMVAGQFATAALVCKVVITLPKGPFEIRVGHRWLEGDEAVAHVKETAACDRAAREAMLALAKERKLEGWPQRCVNCKDETSATCACGTYVCGPACAEHLSASGKCALCAFYTQR